MNPINSSRAKIMALIERIRAATSEPSEYTVYTETRLWLEFQIPPLETIRYELKALGFQWNDCQKCWQLHFRIKRGRNDNTLKRTEPMNSAIEIEQRGASNQVLKGAPGGCCVVTLRECSLLAQSQTTHNTLSKAADYWELNLANNPYLKTHYECFAALMVNAKRSLVGHEMLTSDSNNATYPPQLDLFKKTIVASHIAMILMYYNPSAVINPKAAKLGLIRNWVSAARSSDIDVIEVVVVWRSKYCSVLDEMRLSL
jgi:hypothetical protein